MKQAFAMVEAAIEAIGSAPNNNPSAGWRFSDSESRNLAACVFGVEFDVEAEMQHMTPMKQKVNKYEIIRGTASLQTVRALTYEIHRHLYESPV
jgi:hypothetical protein